MGSGNHPVEVVGRIRSHQPPPQQHHHADAEAQSALAVLPGGTSVRVRTEQGYRDFVLDGVSSSESESLRAFYAKYVESRVDDVRAGGRCTVMMYGPTGSGKSHTMFGSPKEPGVAYLALQHIMSKGVHANATVLEIYNEEIYDLLLNGNGSTTAANPLASPGPRSRAKLEVRGKKVRNATWISAVDPTKLVQEIAKVEKRRIVKSTNSNDRSSRSHCMVIIDILGVNGRLVLVDMAGSENSEQAGTSGLEGKIQTGRINQGNSALRRVVECIANGSPYIPYRDSKLTMLLQDSFEDDGSKILMVLCASPVARDVHKTICTLEYGAKAKCIVRLPSSPPKESAGAATCSDRIEAVLQAKLRLKDEHLEKMRLDLEHKEAELKKLSDRELELADLRVKVETVEAENAQKLEEFQKQMDAVVAERCLEMRRKFGLSEQDEVRRAELESTVEKQRREIELLRDRAEKAEAELRKYQEAVRKKRDVSPEQTGMLALEAKSLNPTAVVASLNFWAGSKPSDSFSFVGSSTEEGSLKESSSGFNFGTSTSPPASGISASELEPEEDLGVKKCASPTQSCPKLVFTESPSIKTRREKIESRVRSRLAFPISEASCNEEKSKGGAAGATKVCLSPDARRAKIENIFMLCGDGRELLRKQNKENVAPV